MLLMKHAYCISGDRNKCRVARISSQEINIVGFYITSQDCVMRIVVSGMGLGCTVDM